MKREDILLYLSTDKINIYLYKAKREYTFDVDTSLFFEWGEIKNVELCREALTEILTKIDFGHRYLKPHVYVLYNDICHCDLKFLYEYALEVLDYSKIDFVPLTKLVKVMKEDSNFVVFDKNYYTNLKRGEKSVSAKVIDKDSIIIGDNKTRHIHYAGEDVIFKTFKTYFTNQKSYGIMNVGDDEC